jgi:capsular polysaccharide transport system permease protein
MQAGCSKNDINCADIVMEFLNALNVQSRVISALTLRETRARYGNSKLGFFWALFEPFAHVVVFIGIFSALDRATPIGDNTGLFILTGIIPWLLYSNIVSKVMTGLSSNKALLGYPQVMPIDITISRVILEFSTLLLVMLFFLGIAVYMGISIRIDSFLEMMKPTGLLILLGTGIGLINASIIPFYPSYKSIFSAFSRPLYFISGVFFTANFLSPEVYEMIDFNPIIHLVEWFRSGFYPSFQSNLYDRDYAISVCVIIFAIGLLVERISSKRARQV